jgi:hypothetical protein
MRPGSGILRGQRSPPSRSSTESRRLWRYRERQRVRSSGGSSGGSHVTASIEVPEDIVERIRTLCLALPEVTVRIGGSLTRARSTAQSSCLPAAREDPAGKPVPLLVSRAGPDERETPLSVGHPFFAPLAGRDRIAVVLTGDTDREKIREPVTESHPILAPKKLTALLD